MKITVLDANTLGEDLSLERLAELGSVSVYGKTLPSEVPERLSDCDVVILNKVRLSEDNLRGAKNLKLICVAATGFDNIDIEYCGKNGITVCNVAGYSTNSVAQVTFATVLELATHIGAFKRSVVSGEYTESGVQNRLTPVYHEIAGKTWGIIGCGNIGGKVASIASAFGCRVIVHKRTPDERYDCVSLETLCKESDIITVHTPLNDSTRGMIGREQLKLMKSDVILVNEARGAVLDEAAVSEAVIDGEIGAFGCDVYSTEPLPKDHPYQRIKSYDNVCLTPHMAWGAYEARERCLSEIIENIKAFFAETPRNKVS